MQDKTRQSMTRQNKRIQDKIRHDKKIQYNTMRGNMDNTRQHKTIRNNTI